jgi:hypothetical protein
MYVREKKTKSPKGKEYGGYWQLVRGYRDSEGKSRQKVVAHLGKFPSREAAIKAAIERGYAVDGHASGAGASS